RWSRSSSEPLEVGQPELDERADGLLEAVLARQLERLLVVRADLVRRHALLEPVVAGEQEVVDLLACLVLVHLWIMKNEMGASRVSVVIADDHRLFAEALEAILSTDARINVIARAADGREAIDLAREHRPDVVLMDIAMPVID